MLTYEACTLCPRMCGVNRAAGARGVCGMDAQMRVARAMPHFWEEPPISGSFGSGAVFFSGCTLGCRFCQNAQISSEGYGAAISPAKLREIFLRLLEEEGCQNINLVTPTHFLPSILPALTPKLPAPVVYNCGGYERVETLRALEGLVDIYLPDFKYWTGALAQDLAGAADYPAVAKAAISEMVRQTGPAQYDAEGGMTRGTLVRHLVLPGQVGNSLDILSWLSEAFPRGTVPVSVMCQYTPMPGMTAPYDRRVTADEYAAVMSWMRLCGLDDGFVQDFDAASGEFIPSFQLEGVL
ncbi:MAG: radical SAM protein [Oscillospiraceae bacterium]|nr:radical SAM protein [Oscillospiraceae bacterium]